MDVIKSLIKWPIVTVYCYVRFFIACALCAIPTLFYILSGNKLTSYTALWNFLSGLPLGKYVFSGIVAVAAPYSSSVYPCIQSLTNSKCVATMPDYEWLRNPFGSLHACALANVGEIACGLCMMCALQVQKHVKGIPIKIEMKYLKKARGTITATGFAAELQVMHDLLDRPIVPRHFFLLFCFVSFSLNP
jgi:acyl-coenzyme A thioesterase PaaI-like protein